MREFLHASYDCEGTCVKITKAFQTYCLRDPGFYVLRVVHKIYHLISDLPYAKDRWSTMCFACEVYHVITQTPLPFLILPSILVVGRPLSIVMTNSTLTATTPPIIDPSLHVIMSSPSSSLKAQGWGYIQ